MKYPLHHFPDSQYLGHPSHAKIGIHPFPDKLYVVTMLSNPLRWRARYSNYWKFQKHVEDAGAILYTAEIAFGGREFEITEPDNPRNLQLRTTDEIWHKENALNLLIQRLPVDAKYVAWIDSDVVFARTDWAQETLHLLQHYDFIQMFSQAQDLNIDNESLGERKGMNGSGVARGFISHWLDSKPDPHDPKFNAGPPDYGIGGYYGNWSHPGLAWAARKESLNKVGGLLDIAITGSADWIMGAALVGNVKMAVYKGTSDGYKKACAEWAERCDQHIKQNVGFMPGLILHHFHGSNKNRNYSFRHLLLENCKFDPAKDLKKDWQGLWQLSGNNLILREGLRKYNRMRNEDEN